MACDYMISDFVIFQKSKDLVQQLVHVIRFHLDTAGDFMISIFVIIPNKNYKAFGTKNCTC